MSHAQKCQGQDLFSRLLRRTHCMKSVRMWIFLVQMWEITDQKISEYGHFSRSDWQVYPETASRKCSVENVFCKIHWETSVSESLFKESCSSNFIKKRLKHRCFPVNFVNFFRTPFFQSASGGRFCLSQCDMRCCKDVAVRCTTQKMKFSVKYFFSNLVTFTEEILNGTLHFLCSDESSFHVADSSGVSLEIIHSRARHQILFLTLNERT